MAADTGMRIVFERPEPESIREVRVAEIDAEALERRAAASTPPGFLRPVGYSASMGYAGGHCSQNDRQLGRFYEMVIETGAKRIESFGVCVQCGYRQQ